MCQYEYQQAEAHMSLENTTKGDGQRDMISGNTEAYFSTLDDADKRSEKRKMKNQSTKKCSSNQIN